jgi:hypothetical protein
MTDLSEESPPQKRPVLVWVICIFYLIGVFWGLLSLGLTRFLLSSAFPIPEAKRHYFESLNYIDYGAMIIRVIVILVGAILLIRLKRSALYFFVGAFVVNILLLVYNIVAKNWFATVGIPGIIGILFEYGIIIAIILYIRHLSKKGVLR